MKLTSSILCVFLADVIFCHIVGNTTRDLYNYALFIFWELEIQNTFILSPFSLCSDYLTMEFCDKLLFQEGLSDEETNNKKDNSLNRQNVKVSNGAKIRNRYKQENPNPKSVYQEKIDQRS